MTVTRASQEVIWLCQLLEKFGFKQDKPTLLLGDNQGAIWQERWEIFNMALLAFGSMIARSYLAANFVWDSRAQYHVASKLNENCVYLG